MLFIVIDDQNDWMGYFGGYLLAKISYLDALVAWGMIFINVHC